ncbi:MAG: prepilin-type N-terminal cleavage/methylation domain-containing protein [candidate division Zixibacteria bacterium]|nr:prepilin-type N-terminal cleavage/methylation domain-containing protein [candidate division Zixibacteria bacterium]
MFYQFLRKSNSGYSLIEMVVVIIIIGIIAAVTMKSLGKATEVSRTEETKKEMELLSYAIAGNPDLIANGSRSDFGYIGDVGAMPANWDALVTNPGGYTSWDGPYIKDEFASGTGDTEFKLDAWGQQYSSPATINFSSTGGGFTITRNIANSSNNLLVNSVFAVLTDLDNSAPGATYSDSVKFVITIPNGAGSYILKSGNPGADGLCQIDSIPIGNHLFQIIYIPNNDTLTRRISVNPGEDIYLNLNYFADVW